MNKTCFIRFEVNKYSLHIRFEPNIAAHPSWAANKSTQNCPNSRKEGRIRKDGRAELPVLVIAVEGLYCKRPILCLASSKFLTPPHRPSVPPRLWGGGEDTFAAWRGGGGNILEDARHCSVLYICKYFVVIALQSAKRPASPAVSRP